MEIPVTTNLQQMIAPASSYSTKQDFEPYTSKCTCCKAGACYNDLHDQPGGACPNDVVMSKKNRHKVCNRCRKPKKSKAGGVSQHTTPYVPRASTLGGTTYVDSRSMMDNTIGGSLSMPNVNMQVIPGMVAMPGLGLPVMANGMGNILMPSPHHMVNDSGTMITAPRQRERIKETGTVNCACQNGGGCHRGKHPYGEACDRLVKLTEADKHTVCKGCRYSKRKAGESNEANDARKKQRGMQSAGGVLGGVGGVSVSSAMTVNGIIQGHGVGVDHNMGTLGGIGGGIGVSVPNGIHVPLPNAIPGLPIPNMLPTPGSVLTPVVGLQDYTATAGVGGELNYSFAVPNPNPQGPGGAPSTDYGI